MATDRADAATYRRAATAATGPQTVTEKIAAKIDEHPAVDSVDHVVGDGTRQFWVTFSQDVVPYGFADLYDLEFVSAWRAPPSYQLRRLFVPRSRITVQFCQEWTPHTATTQGGDDDAGD